MQEEGKAYVRPYGNALLEFDHGKGEWKNDRTRAGKLFSGQHFVMNEDRVWDQWTAFWILLEQNHMTSRPIIILF